jgi:hypothetical protein
MIYDARLRDGPYARGDACCSLAVHSFDVVVRTGSRGNVWKHASTKMNYRVNAVLERSR